MVYDFRLRVHLVATILTSLSSTFMRRTRTDPTIFDLTFPCPECGYKIKPSEILRVDGERVRCPACKRDVLYGTKKPGEPQ